MCAVLTKLCQVSLQNKFKFKKPILKEESNNMEEEGDDMGDDLDGGADIADMANQDISEDEIDDFGLGAGGDKQQEQD